MIDLTPYTDSNGDIDLKKELIQNLAGIITSGSNENGNWWKFEDGLMIQCGEVNYTHAVTQAWGSLFASTNASSVTFPLGFIATPIMVASPRIKSTASAFFGNYSAPTVNQSGAINVTQVFRPTSAESVPFVVHWIAIGRWK